VLYDSNDDIIVLHMMLGGTKVPGDGYAVRYIFIC
jgi:hypothetical protein